MQERRTTPRRTEIDFDAFHRQAQALRSQAFGDIVRRCGQAMARAGKAPLRLLNRM